MYTQLGRANSAEAHTAPRERQARTLRRVHKFTERTHSQRVQRGIQQRWMQTEQLSLRSLLLRERHLREQILAPPPHCSQTLELRAILEAPQRQTLVQIPERHLDRAHWRPHSSKRLSTPGKRFPVKRLTTIRRPPIQDSRCARSKHPAGVACPRLRLEPASDRAAGHKRMDLQRTATSPIRLPDSKLQLHLLPFTQHQRRLQNELPQKPTPHLSARMQRDLHKRRTRQQRGAPHSVISKPWMRQQRQPTREQPTIAIRQPNHRTQQWMLSGAQPRRTHIPGLICPRL